MTAVSLFYANAHLIWKNVNKNEIHHFSLSFFSSSLFNGVRVNKSPFIILFHLLVFFSSFRRTLDWCLLNWCATTSTLFSVFQTLLIFTGHIHIHTHPRGYDLYTLYWIRTEWKKKIMLSVWNKLHPCWCVTSLQQWVNCMATIEQWPEKFCKRANGLKRNYFNCDCGHLFFECASFFSL